MSRPASRRVRPGGPQSAKSASASTCVGRRRMSSGLEHALATDDKQEAQSRELLLDKSGTASAGAYATAAIGARGAATAAGLADRASARRKPTVERSSVSGRLMTTLSNPGSAPSTGTKRTPGAA